MSRISRSARLIAAAACFALFAALGAAVSHALPGPLDRAGFWFFDQCQPLAIAATRSGLFIVYFPMSVLLVGYGLWNRAWLGRMLFLAAMLLVTWFTSDVLKEVFGRVRPEKWLYVHEASASYPSGHAALSLAGYGVLAAYVWTSGAARGWRVAGTLVLALWVVCIDWSRLALGAHYPSDIAGGILLEAGLFLVATAIYDPFRAGAGARTFVG